ncbi:protein MLN51 homolog isoform X2 [Capsella rubella]|uniref:protein MLN51 homolog isoform X2 n=1 Tax=Capsella rubella TaxID=81985 RepID=UPI000CD5730B|nr:protein MLN51 homolog isoform X2 [Capsella rubella]
MATADAGEPEYESDLEEMNRSLATRRREASDDDSDAADDRDVHNQRAEIDSDLSDEHIASVKYDNEEDGEDSYEDEEGGALDNDKMSSVVKDAGDLDGEEAKEKQQAAVPTGGAFYMHDDRFQEMAAGGNRRMRGGRRPWGSGEEGKWGHDKFEEMNTRDKHYDRTPRGRFRGRGRGRGRGQERGNARGSSSNALTGNGQQIYLPKAVTRGRGPRKFETPLTKGNQVHPEQIKQLRNSNGSQNSHEKMSHLDSRRSPTAPANTGNEGVHARKNVAASSLSSASPPFYPSVPSSNLVHGIQVGMEKLHMNESAAPSGKKYRNTKAIVSPVWTAKTSHSTGQGRGAPVTGNVFYQQAHSQGDRFSSPMQLNGDSKGTGQSCIKPSGQGFDQNSAVIRSLSSSPQKASSLRNLFPLGETESAPEIGASITKGKGTLRPSGNGSFMYNGSQMMGRAESLPSADNSTFHTFLPVMQFGGQHGGVPAFGMAYPGYVESEDGVRNPEMTWMPVLSAPGALGASYSPPYVASQAHKPGLPSALGSSSKENSTNNLIDLENSMERPEVTESGVSQQQSNNPSKQTRRYSEMSFSK